MSVPVRLGLFAAALVLVFGGAYLLGDAIDPDADENEVAAGHGDGGSSHSGDDAGDPTRMVVEDRSLDPGAEERLAFRIVDGDGETVEDFDVEHERAMHLIAVRHDLTGYQHLHPTRTEGGGWEVPLSFGEPGDYRLFADFKSRGTAATLHADVRVSGDYRPVELPAPAPSADAGDGYHVAMHTDGDEARFTVTKDGRQVTDIEPYLGARGHLVALRKGDLEFLHVHPQDEATAGGEINFSVSLPSKGRYRLFLQFKHDGRVHTAAFTHAAARGGVHGEAGHGQHDH